ncbi:MAG TPA: pitrilysin family protein [Pseudothermotoga sp.]|nr:pitrilysin family protein [Pseudothermotoga sp.]HOK82828.1 pitrilysin family protein [Pseudothermotoga sp.]HPP69998.1 pitrilysin family protein [Pseudothermotoga sp.]
MKVGRKEIGSCTIYYLPVRGVKTLSVAFVVPAGSAHEPKELAGIAHLLEHVVFKGTKKYEEFTLKYDLEVVGGGLNAFTTKDFTVYYARVPYSHFEKAIDILSELVFNPLIKEDAVELEKSVVTEEIKSFNEDHISRVQDLFAESIMEEPYSRPVSGYEETVTRLNSRVLKEFHSNRYGNLRLVAVGRITKPLLERLESVAVQYNRSVDERDTQVSFKSISHVFEQKNDLTQVHAVTGLSVDLGLTSQEYPAFLVLNTLLGSGMSSLFFTRIREKLGLVYDIDLLSHVWKSSSLLGIYASTSVDKFTRYVDEMKKIFQDASISKSYFEYGKKRLMGKLQMITESVPAMFSYILEFLLAKVEPSELENLIKKVESVKYKDVQRIWKEVCSKEWHWSLLIPKGSEDLIENI